MLLSNPALERAGINARTAQGWVKRMDNDLEWDIYGKLMNRVNRDASQVQEEHKYSLIHLFNEQPHSAEDEHQMAASGRCDTLETRA
ncbi:hypothetical protein G6F42_021803 [Rhizopus arrhizus]|nr:hypothetical protein G6F42_021803 [Rhizopus arrhizus]